MVDERSGSPEPATSSEDGDGSPILAGLVLLFLVVLVILRGCFGTGRTDPMVGIESLEVRGLLNQAYSGLTVDRTRFSRAPFTESSETRFAVTCGMRIQDPARLFSEGSVIVIPEKYLGDLSEHGDSFRIQPFSLRSEWAHGVQFKQIEQISCSFILPITGAPNAVLILEMGDLHFSLDSRTSLVKVSDSYGADSPISVPSDLPPLLLMF